MARLTRVSCSEPGIARKARGRGFSYPSPGGHLQASGIDAAGRRQYLYHADWRAGRDTQKLQRTLPTRTGGGKELLAYRDGSGRWRDIRSTDIDDYLKARGNGGFTAKDFRTRDGVTVGARLQAPTEEDLDDPRVRTRIEAAVLALLRGELEPAHRAA